MTFESINAIVALPEIFLAIAACVVLLIGVYGNREKRVTVGYWISIFSLVIVAFLSGMDFSAPTVYALNGLFIDDPLARLLKTAICLLSAIAFIYGRQYNHDRNLYQSEYYALGLFSITGMLVMVTTNHLLTLYLGLELMSLCLYAMIASDRDNALAVEAAMKYFVLGALASGILLYGMSLLYGLTGSLQLSTIRSVLDVADANNAAIALAVVFIVVALAFKLGAVPFHMWIPDVYHGASTSTTTFLSAAPKIAAFAITLRLLGNGLADLSSMWQEMLIILALLSIAAGNIIAIAQQNLKRMLAYSTIAHMGFFLFGIAVGSAIGYAAALFYILIYSLTSLGAFGVILYLARSGYEADRLDDYKGLSKRYPWISLMMLLLMLSMSGIPPTVGFFAKLLIIQALVSADLIWVAVVAVVLTVIGAFYYLNVIKRMYFDAPEDDNAPHVVAAPADMKLLLLFNVLAIIAILPWLNGLIEICNEAIHRFVA